VFCFLGTILNKGELNRSPPSFFHYKAMTVNQDFSIPRTIRSPSDSLPSYWLRFSGIKRIGGRP
jgi:hypothetical protein